MISRGGIMMDDIRVRKGRRTVTITVTVTREQQARLKALAEANGLNMSELTRYALLRLFREPYIFLSPQYSNSKQSEYDLSAEHEGGSHDEHGG
jgi:hypothetical protein